MSWCVLVVAVLGSPQKRVEEEKGLPPIVSSVNAVMAVPKPPPVGGVTSLSWLLEYVRPVSCLSSCDRVLVIFDTDISCRLGALLDGLVIGLPVAGAVRYVIWQHLRPNAMTGRRAVGSAASIQASLLGNPAVSALLDKWQNALYGAYVYYAKQVCSWDCGCPYPVHGSQTWKCN